MAARDKPILEVRNLVRRFGGLTAVGGLSFEVYPATVHGLIGPNGAGKTTTFNVISGFYSPTNGQVVYQGEDVSGRKTSALAEIGLIRTFQGTTLFQEMTVRDNVRIGCFRCARSSFLSRLLGTDRNIEAAADKQADEILEFFDLRELSAELASNLPHGYQRALGMAVALAAEPKIMLLDEPFTGMNAEETRRMMDHVKQLRGEHDMTIMLVEHDMQAVMGLCDTITVMNFGTLLAEGPPDKIRANPAVIEAYLGSADYAA
jgi:branched-chain amino acid transport system ATP-binding protein